jgi:hypothetical protein
MMRRGFAGLLLVVGYFSGDALAFGPKGHEMVGAIADQRLGGKPVATKVAKLLDGLTLAEAALLADKIKAWDHQSPSNLSTILPDHTSIEDDLRAFFKANPFSTKDPTKLPPNHHWFHYTDVPVVGNGTYSSGKTGRSQFDIVQMIPMCIRVLKGQEPDDNPRKITKSMAVILIAHYVGDLHQPLHVGAQYFDGKGQPTNPDDSGSGFATEGGNNLHLILDRFNDHGRGQDPYILHAYWDNNAVTTALDLVRNDIRADRKTTTGKISDADMARHLASLEPKNWKLAANVAIDQWSEKWADETLSLSRQAYDRLEYRDVKLDQKRKTATGVATEKMQKGAGQSYHDWAGTVVRDGLHKGGWRLADLLQVALQ